MENLLEDRISEVLDILNHTQREILNKIPKKFIEFLKNNASKKYKVNIDYADKNWINNLPDETIEILSLIYRDYVVDKEERNKLIFEEQELLKKIEQEKREKYSYDNLFKNNKATYNEVNNVVENEKTNYLANIPEKTSWFKKIILKIKNVFKGG
ncbi:MAG: hypothetical protein IJH76_00420 [Clostridia bacterium]|nr:hypothetical protein [Clostridia bacterium]